VFSRSSTVDFQFSRFLNVFHCVCWALHRFLVIRLDFVRIFPWFFHAVFDFFWFFNFIPIFFNFFVFFFVVFSNVFLMIFSDFSWRSMGDFCRFLSIFQIFAVFHLKIEENRGKLNKYNGCIEKCWKLVKKSRKIENPQSFWLYGWSLYCTGDAAVNVYSTVWVFIVFTGDAAVNDLCTVQYGSSLYMYRGCCVLRVKSNF